MKEGYYITSNGRITELEFTDIISLNSLNHEDIIMLIMWCDLNVLSDLNKYKYANIDITLHI